MEDLEELSSELQLKGSRLKSRTCVIKFENTLGSPFLISFRYLLKGKFSARGRQ